MVPGQAALSMVVSGGGGGGGASDGARSAGLRPQLNEPKVSSNKWVVLGADWGHWVVRSGGKR